MFSATSFTFRWPFRFGAPTEPVGGHAAAARPLRGWRAQRLPGLDAPWWLLPAAVVLAIAVLMLAAWLSDPGRLPPL